MEFKENTLERLQTKFEVNKSTLPEGQFEAILSTEDLDRHGEHVSIGGMEIPKSNLKMYYNHETSGANLPIGKWLKVWKAGGVLKGLGLIDMQDDFAVKIYKKIMGGFIDSISIGFKPSEFDGEKSTWTKSVLVEASVVAEPANVNAVITSKTLGFTQKDFNKSLVVKLQEATDEVVTKGAVGDVLSQQDKYEEMEDFWEVVYAFSDAYSNPDTKVTEFNSLLSECISILQTIVDGNYQYEDEDEQDGAASSEIKSILRTLKSNVGAVEDTLKASTESPATKLIKVRVAAKQVDKAAEHLNRAIKVKLKETNNV